MPYSAILERINQTALKFLSPLSLEDTYVTVVEEAVKLIEGEDGMILLADPHSHELKKVYGSSTATKNIKVRKRGYSYKSFSEQQAFAISAREYINIHPDMYASGIRSILFIPLFYQEKSIGTLLVRSREEVAFLSGELEILKFFGSMASLAIRKAQLYHETERALKIRDLFMSMAAHELKTPLTTILGYVQLLHSKLKDIHNPEGRWVEQLLHESNRLNSLVSELLQANVIKSGKLQYTWKELSLREVVRKAITTYQFGYPNRIVFFEDKLPIVKDSIIGDADKLRQVFDNLLDNAGKFSPKNSPIRVTLSYEEPFFIIEIQDKGKGIERKDLPHIFEEFYKGGQTNPTSTEEGMGLGLYMVKNIITRHHGKIKIFSSKKEGTTARVMLKKFTL